MRTTSTQSDKEYADYLCTWDDETKIKYIEFLNKYMSEPKILIIEPSMIEKTTKEDINNEINRYITNKYTSLLGSTYIETNMEKQDNTIIKYLKNCGIKCIDARYVKRNYTQINIYIIISNGLQIENRQKKIDTIKNILSEQTKLLKEAQKLNHVLREIIDLLPCAYVVMNKNKCLISKEVVRRRSIIYAPVNMEKKKELKELKELKDENLKKVIYIQDKLSVWRFDDQNCSNILKEKNTVYLYTELKF